MINSLYDWLLKKHRPISCETQGLDAASSSAAFVDLLESRVHAASMEMMRQMQDDILMTDEVSVLVYPTYTSGARRYALKLTTIVDKARVHTMLDGSYRTHRGARRAADIAEQSARAVLRRLRPETFRGMEQAIFPKGTVYVAGVGMVTPK